MRFLLGLLLTAFIALPAGAKPSLEVTLGDKPLKTQYDRYYYYNFGSVPVNFSRYADFTLRNVGNQPVYLRGVFIIGSAFWAWSNCPPYLFPGQACLTRVEFRPWHEGSFNGRLRFAFPTDNIYIDLFGWATRW